MDAIGLLHNAARHYCIDRAATWRMRCAELNAAGHATLKLDSSRSTYTDEARELFPRYLVLDAILREVETFIPADLASLDEARTLLAAAGETAQSQLTRSSEPIEIAAAQDERRRFAAFVRTAEVDQCAAMPQLPFRRALTSTQDRQLHEDFVSRWGRWCGGGTDATDAPPHVTLHVAVMSMTAPVQKIHGARSGSVSTLHDLASRSRFLGFPD